MGPDPEPKNSILSSYYSFRSITSHHINMNTLDDAKCS